MNPHPTPDKSGEWIPRKSDQESPSEGAEDGDDGIVVHGARALLRCPVRDTRGLSMRGARGPGWLAIPGMPVDPGG